MRNILRTIVCCASISLAPLTASAQFGGKAGFSEAFRPDILPRDMVLIVETLKLEDWQRPIVESLIEDYSASCKTGCDAVRAPQVVGPDGAREAVGGAVRQRHRLVLVVERCERRHRSEDLLLHRPAVVREPLEQRR